MPGWVVAFTHSERVAIGEAIEAELGSRNGVRHDSKPAMENFPQVEGATRDLAAKAAGFGNGKTYEQAKRVTNEAALNLLPIYYQSRRSNNQATFEQA